MKTVITGYVRMDTDIPRSLPPVIDEKEFRTLLNQGLWDKVTITIEQEAA